MSDLHVLAAVRGHLLNKEVAPSVHLALPPKASYPLVLIELEEIWSNLYVHAKSIQGRVKFKVSVVSALPHRGEVSSLSDKVRKALEGTTLWLPENGSATVRFLACVAQTPADQGQAGERPRVIHHFYDAVVR